MELPVRGGVTQKQLVAGLASNASLVMAGDALRLQQQQVQRMHIRILRRQVAQLTDGLQCLGLLSKRAVHLFSRQNIRP